MFSSKKTILTLSKFEPSKTKEDIKQLDVSLRSIKGSNQILSTTKERKFLLLGTSLQILFNLEKNLQSFYNKNNPNLKRVRMFKSSKAYLKKYHNHFETVLDILRVIDKEDVIKKDVMTNLSVIFNNLQYDRDSVFEWLMSEYLFYAYIQDKDLKLLVFEKFNKSLSSEQTIVLEKILHKTKLYSNFFESYFMGLDLIESDFYKSAYIKLMRLYENVENKGYKNDNPKNAILQILNDLGSPIDLSDINTKDIYIKSIFDNIAILGSKKESSLDGITKGFFNLISKYYNEKDAQAIVNTTIQNLLTH